MSPSLHRILFLPLAACLVGLAQARDGDLDPTFSGDGALTVDTANRLHDVRLAPAPDGGVFVAGTLRRDNFDYDPTIYRLHADGTAYADFGMLGGIIVPIDYVEDGEDRLLDLFHREDGKLLLVGTTELDDANDDTALIVVRLDETGEREEDFGDDGIVLLPDNPWAAAEATLTLQGVTRQADDALLVSGVVTGLDEDVERRIVLRRIDDDGSPDPDFGEDGWVSIAIDDNYGVEPPRFDVQGRIVIGATVQVPFFGNRGAEVFRFTPEGVPDPTFGSGTGRVEVMADGHVSLTAIAVDREGGILVGVRVGDDVGTTISMAIHRLRQDGSPDTQFGDGGALALNLEDGAIISAMHVREDGRILLAGHIEHTGGTRDFFAARALRDGTLDPGFDGNGVARFEVDPAAEDGAHAVMLSSGRPVLAGVAGDDNDRFAVLRLQSDWMFGDGLE